MSLANWVQFFYFFSLGTVWSCIFQPLISKKVAERGCGRLKKQRSSSQNSTAQDPARPRTHKKKWNNYMRSKKLTKLMFNKVQAKTHLFRFLQGTPAVQKKTQYCWVSRGVCHFWANVLFIISNGDLAKFKYRSTTWIPPIRLPHPPIPHAHKHLSVPPSLAYFNRRETYC